MERKIIKGLKETSIDYLKLKLTALHRQSPRYLRNAAPWSLFSTAISSDQRVSLDSSCPYRERWGCRANFYEFSF